MPGSSLGRESGGVDPGREVDGHLHVPHNPTRAAAAAGALFTDAEGRIMMVRPTYKDYWDIPGGYVEPGETPYEACVREVEEELGIRPAIGRLLVADWAPSERDGDKILFIFNGGQLTDDQRTTIQLQVSELSEYRYLDSGDIEQRTLPRLVRRLSHARDAEATGSTTYLEHGNPVGRTSTR
ncbi:NUDIX domain-containing protein [Actinocatenispora rupis]|uniref:NUDIX hydrolase n=1 Tax=Actinocatenispora rupis TaxID=519421 RepID=A0A8J3J8Z2_9ACTN|nr:NUDIX hydrolase [Actinocatenispora rupis]GID14065.1 NUDIX hydrolase [Actinocatenispora rupis]